MKRFSVITLFPELIEAFAKTSIIGRATEEKILVIDVFNPRDFADDARQTVDDEAYGGGPGMVMQVLPLRRCIAAVRATSESDNVRVLYLSPQGRRLDEHVCAQYSAVDHLVLVSGRYEGVDQRLLERDIDAEISLGDFVLSGGEIAAMAVIDTLARRVPGVLGNADSAANDSFSNGLLEHPHYTRPEEINGQRVPAVLLSGNHAAIDRWRRKMALGNTCLKRPDLLENHTLSADDQALLAEFLSERE